MVDTVMKAKLGGFKGEVREGFSRQLRKELTGAVQGVSSKKRLLVMFHDWYERI